VRSSEIANRLVVGRGRSENCSVVGGGWYMVLRLYLAVAHVD
jgi:hypothetical protein